MTTTSSSALLRLENVQLAFKAGKELHADFVELLSSMSDFEAGLDEHQRARRIENIADGSRASCRSGSSPNSTPHSCGFALRPRRSSPRVVSDVRR
jgi:hypothetical protein